MEEKKQCRYYIPVDIRKVLIHMKQHKFIAGYSHQRALNSIIRNSQEYKDYYNGVNKVTTKESAIGDD